MAEDDDDDRFLYELKSGRKRPRMIPMARFEDYAPGVRARTEKPQGLTWAEWMKLHGMGRGYA